MNIFVKAQDGLKLHIRIPDYAINFVIQGEKNIKYKKENHYAVIDLNSDTSFSISFDMKAVWVAANSNIREDIGKAALVKGPIVYCFEETDNGSNLASVYVDAHSTIEEKYVTVPTECIALYVKGKRMIMEERDLYFLLTSTKCESVELKAIPYAYWCNRVPGEMAVWMKYLNYDPV